MTRPAIRPAESAVMLPVLSLVPRRSTSHHLIMAYINGDWRCDGCDTSRAYEIDHCDLCGETTSAYADRMVS